MAKKETCNLCQNAMSHIYKSCNFQLAFMLSCATGICLSGAADFIEVQCGENGGAAFHIYECKATQQLKASHRVQVCSILDRC